MAAKKKIDFEAGLIELEMLVNQMEGEMPLEESMAAYEKGMALYHALSEKLDASEKRMKTLSGKEDEQ